MLKMSVAAPLLSVLVYVTCAETTSPFTKENFCYVRVTKKRTKIYILSKKKGDYYDVSKESRRHFVCVFMWSVCFICPTLTETGNCRQNLVKISAIIFHIQPSGTSWTLPPTVTDWRTDTTTLSVACFANAPRMLPSKYVNKQNYSFFNSPQFFAIKTPCDKQFWQQNIPLLHIWFCPLTRQHRSVCAYQVIWGSAGLFPMLWVWLWLLHFPCFPSYPFSFSYKPRY